jgi:deoxycytidylate deaminase
MSADDGKVNIHGKTYKTVALRMKEFREDERFDTYRLVTEVLPDSGNHVRVRAAIFDGDDCVATGHGEEERGSSNINKTSALENAETSSIGRALAFLHPDLAGTEIASADEVANALTNQAMQDALEPVKAIMGLFREDGAAMDMVAGVMAHLDQITTVCSNHTTLADLSDEEVHILNAAKEIWQTASEAVQRILWVAPSKGGILSTQHRYLLKL